jgi:hypothetical protein
MTSPRGFRCASAPQARQTPAVSHPLAVQVLAASPLIGGPSAALHFAPLLSIHRMLTESFSPDASLLPEPLTEEMPAVECVGAVVFLRFLKA